MSSNDRLALIRSRYRLIAGVALTQLLPVSRAEIRAEARNVRQRLAHSMDDAILDDEELTPTSCIEIAYETVPTGRHAYTKREDVGVLTAAERAQLARDLVPHRWLKARVAAMPLALPAAVTFAA